MFGKRPIGPDRPAVIVYHPDYISHLGMFPRAADETLFVHTMLTPETPNGEKAEAHWARSFKLMDTDVSNGEDLVVCEQIQRGLSSGANDRLIFGRLEQNLRWFHGSLEEAMGPDGELATNKATPRSASGAVRN